MCCSASKSWLTVCDPRDCSLKHANPSDMDREFTVFPCMLPHRDRRNTHKG